VPLSRRSFLISAALPAAASLSCRKFGPSGTPDEQLATLLGLSTGERSWIEAMTPEDRAHLLGTLSTGTASDDRRSRQLLFRLIEPRDRLFAYVGYPPVNRRRSVCDGLLRE
jgi:hypothetical protein